MTVIVNDTLRTDGPRRKALLRTAGTVVLTVTAGFFTVTGTATPASAQTAFTASQPALDVEEAAFCRSVNAYRSQNGLPALRVSTPLARAATWDTNDMAQKNYFSHTDSLGRDPFKRMTAFGYGYSTAKGENIAARNATASGTFAQWKASAGHNRNMLNASYKVIGISRSYSAASTYKWYWNTDFGGCADASVPCPS